MEIRLLGDVRAVSDDGLPVDIGPPKCQALLAALALSAGKPVAVARLVELVWGSQQPRTAEKTLQSYVTRLRKGLGRDTIVRSGGSYRLAVAPDSVDVHRFQVALEEGDPDRALAEWAGPPFGGLDAEGLDATSEGLIEGWLGATETSLAREVRSAPASAVATLTELTADHPFREELWALLMLGLYRLGRQADSLAAYRRARSRLVEELGVEPGPRLRRLETSILNQDSDLDPDGLPTHGDTDPGPAPRARTAAPGTSLPIPSTQLFGRDDDISAVGEVLDEHRLVTISGLGGAGKTRLALAVAERAKRAGDYPDGVFFASLAPIDEGNRIGRVIVDALGLTIGSADPESLASFIGERQLLLVIDNCEQVIDSVADLVADVLVAGQNGKILATSRETLDIDDEYVFAVPPLPTESADSPGVELLIDRGARLRPGLESDSTALDAFIDICTRLDGIPLALELAAAQLAYLTPAELADRLDDRFELLVRGRPGRVSHHRTLQTTMDWSWELTSAQERALAQQLSVFNGGWTLGAAEGVSDTNEGEPVALGLRSLVAKSLVEHDTPTTGLGKGGSRYRMLETVRLYAQEKLDSSGQADAARDRHARYYCRSADEVAFVDRFLRPNLGARWSAEIDNIIAAVDWLRSRGRLPEAAMLLTMPASTWRFHPIPQTIRQATKELLDQELATVDRCKLLIATSDANTGRTGLVGRGRTAREIVELAEETGDAALISVGLMIEGSPLGVLDPDRAERLLNGCVEWGERAGDQRLVAMGLGMLGGVEAFGRRRFDEARAVLDHAATLASHDGFDRQVILAQQLTLEVMSGDWSAGRDAHRRLLAFHERVELPVNWHDAIDDAVFASQLGESRQRPLATANERLRAAGGDPADWPDLLVIPLGQACNDEDWRRAARIMQAIRASSRGGRRLSSPHATAYYIDFRRRVPSAALDGCAAVTPSVVLADELAAEAP